MASLGTCPRKSQVCKEKAMKPAKELFTTESKDKALSCIVEESRSSAWCDAWYDVVGQVENEVRIQIFNRVQVPLRAKVWHKIR